jgi:hypothetical protein
MFKKEKNNETETNKTLIRMKSSESIHGRIMQKTIEVKQ